METYIYMGGISMVSGFNFRVYGLLRKGGEIYYEP